MLKKLFHNVLKVLPRFKRQRNLMKNTSTFVDSLPTPVFWLNQHKVYQGCNQAFSDLIGLNSSLDIMGLTDKDLPYSVADLSVRDDVFNAILSAESQARILYDCIVGRQDKMIWVQKRFTPLTNSKGKIIGIFGAIVDISEKVNRRKDLESYIERKHVLGILLEELNSKPLLLEGYQKAIEKLILTLQEESQASLALFINANASSPQNFCQFASNTVDAGVFFKNRKVFLKPSVQSEYLDSGVNKFFKDFDQPIESIFFYRIKLNDFVRYDDVILLINPNKDQLDAATIYLSFTHHIIHSFYVSKFLTDTPAKQEPRE